MESRIEEYIKNHHLIADGAFGTYYAEKYGTQELSEFANTRVPERVQTIHREYVEAGARLIRTNTFAANTAAMQTSWEQVADTIRAAAELARAAVSQAGCEQPVWIAGDIGPIPSELPEAEQMEAEYCNIVRTFAECGVKLVDFETFPDLERIQPAIRLAKEEYGLYVMVSFSVNQFGYSSSGRSAKRLLAEAAESACIDATGLNCGMGPGHMQQIYRQLALPKNVVLMALPNAGYATLSRNQLRYGGAPSYFAEKLKQLADLGAAILGGCCGTKPDYIRSLAERGLAEKRQTHVYSGEKPGERQVLRRGFLYDDTGKRKDKRLIAVELAPPFDADDERLLESANLLKNADVDVLTFPDSPSGRTRVDSVLMAEKVRRVTGMEVMPHVCCRDKNGLAIRSLLMGAAVNDIHSLLIITGDPLPTMARQSVKAVFNFDAVGLMKLAQEMNAETFAGRPLCYGGAINQGRRNLEAELARVEKKQEAGAEFFLTQPVFTAEDARRLRRIKRETNACILCGIMPLVSRKNALFMRNEIAGVNVTEEIVNRYPEHGTREEGEAVGVAMARELLAMTEDFADGYYFSFPFNRVYLLPQVLG